MYPCLFTFSGFIIDTNSAYVEPEPENQQDVYQRLNHGKVNFPSNHVLWPKYPFSIVIQGQKCFYPNSNNLLHKFVFCMGIESVR